MKYLLYDILAHIAILVLSPYFLLRMATAKKYRTGLLERFGVLGPGETVDGPLIWCHAVSVGETKAALPLLRYLKGKHPTLKVLFSTVTDTGQGVAEKEGKGVIDSLIYLPLDLSWAIKRVLSRFRPRLFIVVEKEVWPNTYRVLNARGVPVVVVNGTISERSFKRFLLLKPFFRDVFGMISFYCARTGEDLEKALRLGVRSERAAVTGNLKFDFNVSGAAPGPSLADALRIKPSDLCIVAGSTHRGEEEMILNAYRKLADRFPGLKLIIAPRHPERFGEVEALIKDAGVPYRRRTGPQLKEAPLILLDTIGELASAWGLSTVSIVGGSLVPGIGGHNLLEPAALGRPVVYGSHLTAYLYMAEMLEEEGGGVRARDEGELYEALDRLLSDPALRARAGEAARRVVERNRGTVERTAAVIERFL